MAKLTFWEQWFLFWGFPYLMNTKTGEVHYLPRKTAQCGIDNMARKNKRYLSRKKFKKILETKPPLIVVNGCRWCNRSYDLD